MLALRHCAAPSLRSRQETSGSALSLLPWHFFFCQRETSQYATTYYVLYRRSPGYMAKPFISHRLRRQLHTSVQVIANAYQMYSLFRSSRSSSGAEIGKCRKYAFMYGLPILCRSSPHGARSTFLCQLKAVTWRCTTHIHYGHRGMWHRRG